MNAACAITCELIERTLGGNRAYRKVEEALYVVKQGSCYVMINVVPWGEDHAIVRCVSQLVQGVRLDDRLALQLLKLNASLRFGAFAYEENGDLVLFLHSILGGETLDPEELIETIRDVALTADEWDDKIVSQCGGHTMRDLVEEASLSRVIGRPTEELEILDPVD